MEIIHSIEDYINLNADLFRLARVIEENFHHDLDIDRDIIQFDRKLRKFEQIDLRILNTDSKKQAFWINLYNTLVKYLIARLNIRKQISDKPEMFTKFKVKVGQYMFSLDDIEHGILRNNHKAPYNFLPQFKLFDKRKALVCQNLDSRIHFALNNGSKSAPVINFYEPEHIDVQLDIAEYNFSKENFLIDHKAKTINASKVYQWYRHDFGDKYLANPEHRKYKISFKEYDWAIGYSPLE